MKLRIRLSDTRGYVLGEAVRDIAYGERRFELRTPQSPFDPSMGAAMIVEVKLEDLDELYAASRALAAIVGQS